MVNLCLQPGEARNIAVRTRFAFGTAHAGGTATLTSAAKEQYLAIIAAAEADADDEDAADQAAAEAQFVSAFQGVRSTGTSSAQALNVARPAGLVPASFDPETQPFVPLGVILETPLDNPAFGNSLTSADQVWEHVDQIPDLVVVEPGTYRITMTARGTAGVNAGTAVGTAFVYAGVALNGAVIPGTETVVAGQQKAAGAATPAFQVESSGTVTFTKDLHPGDVLRLYGARLSNNSSVTSISSSAIGRSRLVAQRIALSV